MRKTRAHPAIWAWGAQALIRKRGEKTDYNEIASLGHDRGELVVVTRAELIQVNDPTWPKETAQALLQVIGVHVDYQGSGIAPHALDDAVARLAALAPDVESVLVRARVHGSNLPSKKMMTGYGFTSVELASMTDPFETWSIKIDLG